MKSRNLLMAASLVAFCAFGNAAQAALITGPTEITATTTITSGGFGSLEQIVDGVDLYTDGAPFNGWGPDVMAGTISLTFSGVYTIYDFILANDINVQQEGVRDFRLSFYDEVGQLITTTGTFTALGGYLPVQTFNVGTVEGVKRVDLEVLNVYTANVPRIEIREVAFNGVAVIPEPSSTVLAGLSVAGLAFFRRRAGRN